MNLKVSTSGSLGGIYGRQTSNGTGFSSGIRGIPATINPQTLHITFISNTIADKDCLSTEEHL